MSKEIKNLLKLALEKDASSFKDSMNDIISSRIQAQLDVRKDEISADIMKTEESVELDEVSVGTSRYRKSHGKSPNPKEKGSWYFTDTDQLSKNDHIFKTKGGTSYKDAQKQAIEFAKKKGLRKIYVMSSYDSALDEASYTFKNSGEASKFMKAVTQAGIDKKVLKSKGNSVTVGKLKDKDMQQMLDLMAKDMKATVKG